MNIQQIAPHAPEVQQVWQLREDVLRKPLGLSLKDEDLSGEKEEITLAALEGTDVVACVLLRLLPDGKARLRQMAVRPDRQGKGIGKALLEAAEAIAIEKEALFMELHARETAVAFYENAGYHTSGKPFEEVGIPHIKMEKTFSL